MLLFIILLRRGRLCQAGNNAACPDFAEVVGFNAVIVQEEAGGAEVCRIEVLRGIGGEFHIFHAFPRLSTP